METFGSIYGRNMVGENDGKWNGQTDFWLEKYAIILIDGLEIHMDFFAQKIKWISDFWFWWLNKIG